VRVDEHTIELAGSPVFFRTAPAGGTPPLYLHGIPTSSDDWVGVLERTGGIAPDLIGFGRSGKGGHLEYSLTGLAQHVAQLLDHLEVPIVTLVAHDWGAPVGLTLATHHPTRIERIVLINPLPLSLDADKTPASRLWRTKAIGELTMGATTKWLMRRALKNASTNPDHTWPPQRVDQVWEQFDQGSQRAILRLHRATDEGALTTLRDNLIRLDPPALIFSSEDDPWFAPRSANAYADSLPTATLEQLPNTGHWPWLDSDEALERLAQAVE
jgi:pimeloyl-ACP methyl ester carboxylesterase